MSNPYSGTGSYTSFSGPSLSMYRRTSYASVAAGMATSGSSATSPPTRSGAFSHLANTSPGAGMQQQSQSRRASRSMDVDGAHGPASWGKSGLSGYGEGHALLAMLDAPPLFTPSYLKNSRHVERLELAHKARLQALRDARHPSHPTAGPGSLSTSSSSANLHKQLSSSHVQRGPVQDVIERLPPAIADDALHLLPTRWSEADKCPGLEVLAEGAEVRFQGVTKSSDDAVAVRSDHPMPKECGIYYFEVTVLSRGKEGLIGIGFSSSKASLSRLPGWEPESWAYHGDDGFSFMCTASGKPYGPKFSAMDVIGCGVNFRTGNAFFTKNGIFLGNAFHNIKSDKLFPSVGMKKPGEHLRVNFGQTPFVYDIDMMMQGERSAVAEEINKTAITTLQPTLDETSLVQELIAEYLAHDGYVETARAFAQEVHSERTSLSGNKQPLQSFDPKTDVDAINRQKIRVAILDGDIDKALKYIGAYYPHVLEKEQNRDVYFKLRCRKFIEMMGRLSDLQNAAYLPSPAVAAPSNGHLGQDVRPDDYDSDVFDHQMELDDQLHHESKPPAHPSIPGELAGDAMDTRNDALKPAPASASELKSAAMRHNGLMTEAIQYGCELRVEFSSDPRKEVKQALEDTFALIAYTDARESVLGGLMEGKGRVEIAEEVNGAILVSLGKPSLATLEKLCAQTETLVDMLGGDGGAGAFVNVKKYL